MPSLYFLPNLSILGNGITQSSRKNDVMKIYIVTYIKLRSQSPNLLLNVAQMRTALCLPWKRHSTLSAMSPYRFTAPWVSRELQDQQGPPFEGILSPGRGVNSTFPGTFMARNLFSFCWKHADMWWKKGAYFTILHSNVRYKSQANQSYFPPWPCVRITCGWKALLSADLTADCLMRKKNDWK